MGGSKIITYSDFSSGVYFGSLLLLSFCKFDPSTPKNANGPICAKKDTLTFLLLSLHQVSFLYLPIPITFKLAKQFFTSKNDFKNQNCVTFVGSVQNTNIKYS